jgi:iron(III) transport system permease protein
VTVSRQTNWLFTGIKIRESHVLVAVILGLLIYLVFIPFVLLVLSGFKETGFIFDEGYTFRHYIDIYTDAGTYRLIINTMIFAISSTFMALSLGVIFAWLTERTNIPFKTAVRVSLIIPLAVPGVLLSIGWIMLASPRIGMLNSVFVGIFGGGAPLDIFTMEGMIFVQGLSFTPTAYLIISPSFRRMDPLLEEAASISGASMFETLRYIALPLLLPGILAAGAAIFLISLVVFDIPGTLGLPSNIFVFASEIFDAVNPVEGVPEFGRIGALSSLFLFFTFILAYYYNHMTRRAGKYTTVTGKGYRPKLIDLGNWKYFALGTICLYVVLALVLPFLTIFWTSLLPFFQPFSVQALDNLSFDGYIETLGLPVVQLALWNTLIVVIVTSAVVALFATMISWLIVHSNPFIRRSLDFLAFLPLAIPHLMLSLALIYLYLTIKFIPVYGTVWILVIAFITTYIAFGTRTTNAAMFQLHRELEEAAWVGGASNLRAFKEIVVPLIFPAMLNVIIWVAALSMRELSAALMLRSADNMVISTIIWDFWAEDAQPSNAAVLGVVMILILLVFTGIGLYLYERSALTARSPDSGKEMPVGDAASQPSQR